MNYYNRYKDFERNENLIIIPYIKLPSKLTDFQIIWEEDSRLDRLSMEYYGNPYGGFLIALKNADKGFDEFEYKVGEQIIIPFPYRDSIEQYKNQVELYFNTEKIE